MLHTLVLRRQHFKKRKKDGDRLRAKGRSIDSRSDHLIKQHIPQHLLRSWTMPLLRVTMAHSS